jgi:hypothetical protein
VLVAEGDLELVGRRCRRSGRSDCKQGQCREDGLVAGLHFGVGDLRLLEKSECVGKSRGALDVKLEMRCGVCLVDDGTFSMYQSSV